jgi:squalene synthase HpnC
VSSTAASSTGVTAASAPAPLARAYAVCEAFARAHYENFPVASRLLPAAMRPHIAAVYAFARTADDIADEGRDPAAVRMTRLDAWQRRLHAALAADDVASDDGAASDGRAASDDRDDLILAATAHSIRTRDLPVALFDDLLSAFRQDITTTRYDSWSEVHDYCRRSANPVGRLVLRIGGYHDARLDASSDALCTALQLTNFWQDFGRDWQSGRLYVPRSAASAAGADEADLYAGRMSEAWARALAECIDVTARAFADGRAVCDGVRGRLRVELRFTWLGGRRILERAHRLRRDLLHVRPTLGARDLAPLVWRALTWKGAAA